MPSVYFPSDQLILLLCSLFCLSQVHSGSKNIYFSSAVCCNFVSGYFLLALNFSAVSCVLSIFRIVDISSLLRISLAKSSVSCEAVKFYMFFCYGSHCSSSFLFPVINQFLSFEKYNNITQKFYTRKI